MLLSMANGAANRMSAMSFFGCPNPVSAW